MLKLSGRRIFLIKISRGDIIQYEDKEYSVVSKQNKKIFIMENKGLGNYSLENGYGGQTLDCKYIDINDKDIIKIS